MRPPDQAVVSLGFTCFRLEAYVAVKALFPRTAFAPFHRPPQAKWLR